jgi:hypothetical protein
MESAGRWWLTPVILATWEVEIWKIRFKASLGKKQEPTSKISREKGAGGVA